MLCAVTVRSIKPGSYEAFRQEWEPQPWPPELSRVLILRNDQDPDQVLTASFLDLPPDQLDELRDDPSLLEAEESRLARISESEESVVFKGIFEVAEEIVAPGTPA
jgi:hypothetical protein